MDQTFEFRELMRRYRHHVEQHADADLKLSYDRPRYSPSPFIMQASDMVTNHLPSTLKIISHFSFFRAKTIN